MFRFGQRLALSLFFALAVVLLGTVFLARTVEAQADVGLLFTAPDGSPCAGPCLLGARPGETMLDDAVQLLKRHPLTRDLIAVPDPARDGMLFGGDSVSIGLIGDSEGRLALIDVLLEPPALLNGRDLPPSVLQGTRLRDILATLGAPDFVEFTASDTGPMLQAYYQQRHVFILAGRDDASRIDGDSALVFMYVARQEAAVRPSMYPWHGLSRVWRYFDVHFGG